jgi:LPXTG-site transpeptidase (sortase) family protein
MLVRTMRPLLSLGLALLMLAGAGVATVGYVDQTQVQVVLSGPNTVRCNRSATISARVVSTENGRPVRNQVVSWALTQTQSSGDGLSAASTITNRRGNTSVTLSFGPAAGPRTVRASVTVTSPSITIRCAGGLPRTSTRPPDGFVAAPSDALLMPPAGPNIDSSSAPLPATGVRLDRLGIDLPLVEGDGVSVPEGAAAHYPGTAWPGEGSNTYVYAHAREGHFLELWQVRTGDVVDVDLADGSVAQYRVSRILPTVAWDAIEMLAPTSTEILTLQTCLTYDVTAPRFVVIAERIAQA